MSEPIRFVFRGQVVTVHDAPITQTVLQFLREQVSACGTKEGCAEGDCGACTAVVLSLPDGVTPTVGAPGAELALRTVNSCIQLLPTLQGKALLTVEDLKVMAGGALHPAQRAMVACHGSQCGFCTPGFVMSLFGSYERAQQTNAVPTRQALADELSGNLCRCTGYRPILDAGQAMFSEPPVRLDTRPLHALLQGLQRADSFHYEGPSQSVSGRVDHFYAPTSLAVFATVRAAQPNARLLAGSTDIGLWVTKQFRDVGDLLFIGDVPELKRVERTPTRLSIGAAVSLEAGYAALCESYPELKEVWLRFASPPIRNAGTLVGNLANGSPIGDTAPMLMALGARLTLRKGERTREVPLDAFYLAYMKNQLEPGEFVQSVELTRREAGVRFRGYKISKRFDCDISAVSAGLLVRVDGGRVVEARFAFGGMAAVVKRASDAEAAVFGQPWSEATVKAAMAKLAVDFQPLSDLRASNEYRATVSANLLYRFWLETRDEAPLAAAATSVFARGERAS